MIIDLEMLLDSNVSGLERLARHLRITPGAFQGETTLEYRHRLAEEIETAIRTLRVRDRLFPHHRSVVAA